MHTIADGRRLPRMAGGIPLARSGVPDELSLGQLPVQVARISQESNGKENRGGKSVFLPHRHAGNVRDVVHPTLLGFEMYFAILVVGVGKKILDVIANFLFLCFLIRRLQEVKGRENFLVSEIAIDGSRN